MSNFVGSATETLICLLKDYKENALIERMRQQRATKK